MLSKTHDASRLIPLLVLPMCGVTFVLHAVGVSQEANYDESRVPVYTLPDALRHADGTPVTTIDDWQRRRRAELLALFQEHVYGAMPPALPVHADLVDTDEHALSGLGLRKEVTLYFSKDGSGPRVHLLILVPNEQVGASPIPSFLGLNFHGNHTVHSDTKIHLHPTWTSEGVLATPASSTRGANAARWQAEKVLGRGYALVTAYYGDIDPDFDDGFQNGVHVLYPTYRERGDNWAAIGAWAWGLSRVLDYLETDNQIDANRVALIGHSRLGKTALWAGATDERFAMVISNNSGCGGAALARRRFGETITRINTVFPHWFCRNHRRYNDHETELPVDQHELLALVAPRPLYVASAKEDGWADPRGEFLACVGADPVYRFLGTEGLPTDQWPAVDQPIGGRIGYHVRSGKHDVTAYDWEQYLRFADKHLARISHVGRQQGRKDLPEQRKRN